MNFVVLGDDPVVLGLLRSIAAHGEHAVAHVVGAGSLLPDVLQLFPAARVVSAWDELLAAKFDAVVVSGDDAELLTGAKHLASGRKGLIVFPHAAQGSAWVYELTLMEEEQTELVPVFERRLHPSVRFARRMLAEGGIGRLLHFDFERGGAAGPGIADGRHTSDHGSGAGLQETMHTTSGGMVRHGPPPPLLSLAEVDQMLLQDVDLLRFLGGNYSQVTALVSRVDGEAVSRATVTLAGESLPEATWTLQPGVGQTGWRLQMAGERGEILLTGGESAAEIEVTSRSESLREFERATFDDGAAVLDELERALTGGPRASTWTDLVRAFDLVDGAHRSIRRRRTIDLQFETTSERNQFKTQMTAAGCGVLIFTLLAVVLLLVISAVFDPRDRTEIAAEAADAIVYREEFLAASPELTAEGRRHVDEIADRMLRLASGEFPVLIEQRDAEASPLDERRREQIVERLTERGAENAAQRTLVAPLEGRAFGAVMRVARIVVWAPMVLFLISQVLLFVAKPASGDRAGDAKEGQTSKQEVRNA